RDYAVGINIRSGHYLASLCAILDQMREQGYAYEILFMDAEDYVLIIPYKETRRNHPLSLNKRIDAAVRLEREKTAFLKARADYIIDTSHLLTRELKGEIVKIFVLNRKFDSLVVSILSFGFKYGIPSDSDMVFDVRFIRNPYYIPQLRPLTGNDTPVSEYVMASAAACKFAKQLEEMMLFLIPNYILEGKNQLVISIGCTGGRHRSVTIANQLYNKLKENSNYVLRIEHRDIDREIKS
ncbi:MAG: RNase adapter RapZ, partial [Lachnospiraceae bacterium]